MNENKTQEFVFDKSLSKRPCIYGRIGNELHPIVYFQKAKYASKEEYEQVMRILFRKSK